MKADSSRKPEVQVAQEIADQSALSQEVLLRVEKVIVLAVKLLPRGSSAVDPSMVEDYAEAERLRMRQK